MTRSERLQRPVVWLGVATSVGMLIVLVMGFWVTSSNAGQGCGRDWPLCQGKFIPELALATGIEFSHRAVTAVESVLVIAFAAATLWLYGRQRPIQVLAPLMLAFLFIQAGMGAAAVVYPETAVVLALHFGISLIAVASTALTAAYVARPGPMRSAPVAPGVVRAATWTMVAYLYVLVYSGAYIRHAGDAAACTSWPLCTTGAPLGAAAVAVDLLHRFGAAAALLGAVGLVLLYHRAAPERRDLTRAAAALTAMFVVQGGAGALLVLSSWSISAELLHAALTGITFSVAAYLCLRVTLGVRTEPATAPARPRLSAEGAQ